MELLCKSFAQCTITQHYIFHTIHALTFYSFSFAHSTRRSLHACARFNPPPHIVYMYLDILPESAASIDCLGRYPLHVAAGTRSNIQVLDIIAQAYPNACDSQDDDGKTPLMLACDTSCELFEDDNEIRREPPSCEVIMTLMKASPYSLLLEDEDGMSALEHSIFSDAPFEVVKLLQRGTKELREIQHREKGLTPSTSLEQKSMTACEDKIELREAVVIPAMEEEFSQNTMMKDMCTSKFTAVVMC